MMKSEFKKIIIPILLIFLLSSPSLGNVLLNQQIDAALQQALNNKNVKKTLSQHSKNNQNNQSKSKNKKNNLSTNKKNNTKNNNLKKDLAIDYSDLYEEEEEEEEEYIQSNLEEKLNKTEIQKSIAIPKYYFKEKLKTEIIPTTKNVLLNKELEETIIKQFGYDIFNADLDNILDMNIPVSDDYILGSGDNLIIRIWGKIEQQIEVNIDNNGKIYIPKIGNILLSGISYKNAHTVIKKALQKQYVNFELSLTMGSLKTIKVFILGEVNNPGSYDISSLSTLFTALHAANGPTKKGTLRNIKLKRNNKTITTVDLYQYLLSGNNNHDQKLKNYDTIFVPPIGSIIKIEGDVKRPAIYELNGKTSVHSAIYKLAGGVWGTSDQSIISVKRIKNNKHRTLLNIETNHKNLVETLKKTIVKDNDQITISSILDEEKNTVRIIGAIKKPGIYSYTPNMSLLNLIQKAEGIASRADKKKIKLFRYISNQQKELIIIDGTEKETLINTKLKDWDVIEIDEIIKEYVFIQGSVKSPGTYQRFKNLTVSDLIQLATLSPSAALKGELIKYNAENESKVISLNISNILSNPQSTENYVLEANDTIFIPDNPELKTKKSITISGEVLYPGTYIINHNESLQSLINRAGGFTKEALINGLELNRKSIKDKEISGHKFFMEEEQKRILFTKEFLENQKPILSFIKEQEKKSEGRIIIDFKQEDILSNIILENEDTIYIPKQSNIIPVIGGVQTARGVSYKKNKSTRYYVNKAGGRNQFALKRKAYVFKANGVIKKNPSKIELGDTIYIPQEIKEKWSKRYGMEFWERIINIVANTFQTIIIYKQLYN